ncbi:alternative ribosome rescue aminoacyl-tRNA hydrolase ArfB [Pseudoteredinibacter isoporae]|uniref:Peptidyl-tRNA hydrolase ArfB n=1 Tax=Pseudoteredinibacter isoporae TaxID=570281 RepID=A0A7X0JVA2_9GAMM|nr:alternative ribosome rescue aminoacyl-tRNA hydrolase ArfB [Pseudoteredinibacter isoporae]MBB6522070.1 ribosome-associated protein [Pseudoteredinibacter isoporae]NHO87605.1 aminoacyl-tRNA hydrolase [Pseudoteredinibacter isoporae]NIB24064.1 aminoacyl-tRNA hydrolase [Pseudoteredinibacter isoporae]
MLKISNNVFLADEEIELKAIRSQGSGGQNVNKVSSAIHLRFDIHKSSLPEFYRERLLTLQDQRISKDGIIVIKAQEYRSQDKNRVAALERLQSLIRSVSYTQKKRRATQPSRAAKKRRLDSKNKRGQIKANRAKPTF